MKSKLSAALVAATCALAAPAHADIVGDTIHAYRLFPDAGTVLVDLGTFTVPGGGCSECAQNSGIAYNVTGTQITITLQGLSSFLLPPPLTDLNLWMSPRTRASLGSP
jgi:hypothetical protein